MLIINADDWGRSAPETDAALACHTVGAVTSVSAMVFMQDSERAAQLAKSANVDVGLHLNLSETFSGPNVPSSVRQSHERIVRFLRRGKYALLVYNPRLRAAFRQTYEVQAQEFLRLYGRSPSHVDGHQHMHLCTNLLIAQIIPAGQRVRRSFSFTRGERGLINRTYRKLVDWRLAQTYRLTDHFFALADSIRPGRMDYIANLAQTSTVELMTHPVYDKENSFLLSDPYLQIIHSLPVGSFAQT